MPINFNHKQSAHCESGVTSSIFNYYGLDFSEAMVFGIGSGLFFLYFPFVKINYLPLVSFRSFPTSILKKTAKRIGVKLNVKKFSDPSKAMDRLDQLIEEGIPVGLQVGVYWLPYFPPAYRFHFNAHNIVVYGKEGDQYIISDPVFEKPVLCPYNDLSKARFAKGPLAPKGRMYHISRVPSKINLRRAVIKGIKEQCHRMLYAPIPMAGVRGIRYLAKHMVRWPEKYGKRKASLYLGQVIRMQEEIGTGGAGFRFLYASFLQEAADAIGEPLLFKLAEKMTYAGDTWREFARIGARNCKRRADPSESYAALSSLLYECASVEESIFNALKKLKK